MAPIRTLPVLLSQVAAIRDTTEAAWSLSRDIIFDTRQVTDAQLTSFIDILSGYCGNDRVPYTVTCSLIELLWYGVRSRPSIPFEKRLTWLDRLSDLGCDQKVRDAVAFFAKEGRYVEYSLVKRWVENGMRGGRKTKFAALTLLIGDQRYFRVTSTADLCDYLESASRDYRGDHGILRLFAMLVLRMKHVTPRARIYPRGIDALAGALYAFGRFDDFSLSYLIDWTMKLTPDAREAVRSRFTELVQLETARLNGYLAFFEPATAPAQS